MRTPLILLKVIGKAVLNCVGAGVLGDIVIDAVPEIANNVWDERGKKKTVDERGAELGAVAQATGEEMREGIEEIVQDIAAGTPADFRQSLTGYLSQVPVTVRQMLRRPADPTGRTLPPGLELRKGEAL